MNLTLKDVGKKYTRNQTDFWALRHVNLSAKTGDFISIVGKSGSGKSTLLNLIAGMISPTEGEVLYDEISYIGAPDKIISKFRNQKIGYVAQGQSLLSNLTVWDNIRFPNQLYDSEKKVSAKELEELMDKLGIRDLKTSYPEQLSGGEMRRVAIARALVNSPDILLADEPTGDLDEENTRIILEIFKELAKKGTIIFMVTHDKETVAYSTSAYAILDGNMTKFVKNIDNME